MSDLELIIAIALAVAFPLLVAVAIYKLMLRRPARETALVFDRAALKSAEDALRASDEKNWVVLKRCHGPGYTHTAMIDIVNALAAEGVEATYDVVGTSSADGGVTNYMIKVVQGSEERALEILARLGEAPDVSE